MTMYYPKTDAERKALRHQSVTSTQVAALFGHSPYHTAFELAVEKKGKPEDIPGTERMIWGIRLQEAIAKGISVDYGVKVRRVNGIATRNSRMSASYDYEIVGRIDDAPAPSDPMLRQMYTDLGPGILEIKNVDRFIFNKEWKLDEGLLEAPAHIEIQVQSELHCIERQWGVMGVLVGGNETQLVLRERDIEVGNAIEERVGEFWALLGGGGMPPIKLPEDVDIIRKIYLYAEPGKILDAREDAEMLEWCKSYVAERELAKAHEDARKSIGARILQKIGNAEKVLLAGYGITANTVSETEIAAYTRKAFRNLTVREKAQPKGKDNAK